MGGKGPCRRGLSAGGCIGLWFGLRRRVTWEARVGRWIAVMAVVAVAVTAGWEARAGERRDLVIASGEADGYYFPAAGALCRVLNKDRPHGYTCVVEPSSGSAANLAALRSGEADLAVIQSRAAILAFQGGEGFKDGPQPDLRALMSLHAEATLALVRPDAGIDQPAALKGKRVNLGKPGSFQRLMADAVLAAAGLSEGDLAAAVELDLGEQAQELCDGNIDAAFFSGVHPMAEAAAAIEQCGAQPLAMLGRGTEAVLKQSPWLSRTVIKGDSYDGIGDSQTTLGMRALLVTTTRLSADEAYDLVKALHANFSALARLHPVFKGLTKAESAREGLSIPLHDGVRKLYGESGLGK